MRSPGITLIGGPEHLSGKAPLFVKEGLRLHLVEDGGSFPTSCDEVITKQSESCRFATGFQAERQTVVVRGALEAPRQIEGLRPQAKSHDVQRLAAQHLG